mgnify:CR=1 FL=1
MLRSIVVAVLSLFAGSALAVDTTFLLVNSTAYPISELSVSQTQLSMWSPNLLRPPVIKAGESRQMPVQFVIDPALPASVNTVTLSYTFFEVPAADKKNAAAPVVAAGSAG